MSNEELTIRDRLEDILESIELVAKLQKKLVKNNRFWKINAIRPKIKVKRGRTWKLKNQGNAKYGGLVKELGFQIVTRIGLDRVVKLPSKSGQNTTFLTIRFLFRKLLHFA